MNQLRPNPGLTKFLASIGIVQAIKVRGGAGFAVRDFLALLWGITDEVMLNELTALFLASNKEASKIIRDFWIKPLPREYKQLFLKHLGAPLPSSIDDLAEFINALSAALVPHGYRLIYDKEVKVFRLIHRLKEQGEKQRRPLEKAIYRLSQSHLVPIPASKPI